MKFRPNEQLTYVAQIQGITLDNWCRVSLTMLRTSCSLPLAFVKDEGKQHMENNNNNIQWEDGNANNNNTITRNINENSKNTNN